MFAFWATGAGLLVGIVGFGITLRQLRAVKTATEAAEGAIAGLKIRFSHFDVIQEMTVAETALSALRKLAIDADLSKSSEAHDILTTSILKLRERFLHTDEDITRQLDETISALESLPRLLKNSDSYQNNIVCQKYLNGLRTAHTSLVKIRFKIQQEQ